MGIEENLLKYKREASVKKMNGEGAGVYEKETHQHIKCHFKWMNFSEYI